MTNIVGLNILFSVYISPAVSVHSYGVSCCDVITRRRTAACPCIIFPLLYHCLFEFFLWQFLLDFPSHIWFNILRFQFSRRLRRNKTVSIVEVVYFPFPIQTPVVRLSFNPEFFNFCVIMFIFLNYV